MKQMSSGDVRVEEEVVEEEAVEGDSPRVEPWSVSSLRVIR